MEWWIVADVGRWWVMLWFGVVVWTGGWFLLRGVVDGVCDGWLVDDGCGWRIVNGGLCTGVVVAVAMYTPTHIHVHDCLFVIKCIQAQISKTITAGVFLIRGIVQPVTCCGCPLTQNLMCANEFNPTCLNMNKTQMYAFRFECVYTFEDTCIHM